MRTGEYLAGNLPVVGFLLSLGRWPLGPAGATPAASDARSQTRAWLCREQRQLVLHWSRGWFDVLAASDRSNGQAQPLMAGDAGVR